MRVSPIGRVVGLFALGGCGAGAMALLVRELPSGDPIDQAADELPLVEAPSAPWPDAWRVPADRTPAPWETVEFPDPTDLLARLNADVMVATVDEGATLRVLDDRLTGVEPSPDGRWIAIGRDVPALVRVSTGTVERELLDQAGCVPRAWDGAGERVLLGCSRHGGKTRYAVWTVADDGIVEVPLDVWSERASWVPTVNSWWLDPDYNASGGWLTPSGEWTPEAVSVADPRGTGTIEHGLDVLFSADGTATMAYRAGYRGTGVVRLWDGERYRSTGGDLPDSLFDGYGSVIALLDGGVLFSTTGSRPATAYAADGTLLWKPNEEQRPRYRKGAVAFAAATGRCPGVGTTVLDPGSPASRVDRVSSDGRVGVSGPLGVHMASGDGFQLPGGPSMRRTVAPVDAHRVLVHAHRFVGLFDTRVSRFTWARGDATVLWQEGTSVVATWEGHTWRLDLKAWTARRVPGTASVTGDSLFVRPDAWSGWFEDLDGRPIRRVDIVHPEPEAPQPRKWGEAVGAHHQAGWVSWPVGEDLLVVSRHDPQQALRIPAGVETFGFREAHPFCGTGYIPPAVGWRAPDKGALYLLSPAGSLHVLRAAPEFIVRGAANMFYRSGEPATVDEIDRWDATLRAPTQRLDSRRFDRPDHRSKVVVHPLGARPSATAPPRAAAPLPPMVALLPSVEPQRTPATAAVDLRMLPGDGWVWFERETQATGRDPRGMVVVEGGGGPVRPTPLQTPVEPLGAPPPVAFGPCPWDAP